MKKNNNGITLLSLTVTVIVLLILAAVATSTGLNTIRSSKYTKLVTELEMIQTQVNLLNQKYQNEINALAEGENFDKLGKDLKNSNEEEESFSGAEETDKTGYRYFDVDEIKKSLEIDGIENEYLINIAKRKAIILGGITYDGQTYYTLNQLKDIPEVGTFVREEDDNVTIEGISYQTIEDGYKITLKNIQCSKYVGKYDVKFRKSNEVTYQTIETGITGNNYTFEVDSLGIYQVRIIDAAGKIADKEINVVAGEKFETETKIKLDEEIITIPAGATVSGVVEENSNIRNGFVIYMIPDGEEVDWSKAAEIEEAREKYSQFVWIPVKNAILDLSSNATALQNETNIKAAVQTQIEAGKYPMAIKKDATNYFGILYEFNINTVGGTNLNVEIGLNSNWTPLNETNTYSREPSYLSNTTNADGNTTYNNIGITQEVLQNDFNEMAAKVEKNYGFWIGRYETSNLSTDKTKDSSNKIKSVKNAVAGLNNVNWYRMYAQQKNYAKLELGNTT